MLKFEDCTPGYYWVEYFSKVLNTKDVFIAELTAYDDGSSSWWTTGWDCPFTFDDSYTILEKIEYVKKEEA